MKFRLLDGSHSMEMPDGSVQTFRKKANEVGPVIETDSDLCRKFNANGTSLKFERLPDDAKVSKAHSVLPPMDDPTSGAKRQPVTPVSEPVGDDGDDDKTISSTGSVDTSVFDDMTLPQLKKHAEEEEIDLRGKTHKADILDIIKQHAAAAG